MYENGIAWMIGQAERSNRERDGREARQRAELTAAQESRRTLREGILDRIGSLVRGSSVPDAACCAA